MEDDDKRNCLGRVGISLIILERIQKSSYVPPWRNIENFNICTFLKDGGGESEDLQELRKISDEMVTEQMEEAEVVT